MSLVRSTAPLIVLASLAASCTRPVVGRDFQGASITDLTVEPANVREGVPITIEFSLAGGPEGNVTYTIGNKSNDCSATELPGGRFQCVSSGVTRQDYPQGDVDVVVKAKDRLGKESEANARIKLDF